MSIFASKNKKQSDKPKEKLNEQDKIKIHNHFVKLGCKSWASRKAKILAGKL